MSVQAATLGELSVNRGETVEVLEETTPTRWQVKNIYGGVGTIPAQLVEVIIKKKSTSELMRGEIQTLDWKR